MNILIIGETCNDRFVYGSVNRLCPEAPVPVFKEIKEINTLGMASNVKNNLNSCAIDLNIDINISILTNKKNGFKTRYIDSASNQMLLRVDSDTYNEIDQNELFSIKFESYDAVIVSDYNKGFLSNRDLSYISKSSKLSFLDTKKKYNPEWSHSFSFIKINEKEYKENGFEENHDKCKFNTIVTLGSNGCQFNNDIFPLKTVSQIRDVSGAGDTFLASFAIKYLCTKNIQLSIDYAQKCCSIVVSKSGVATI